MKYLHLLFIALFLMPLVAGAQTFKTGYVVNTKGDTLKGYVGFRRPGKNPGEIYFKNNLNQAKKDTFDVSNTSAFYMEGAGIFRTFRLSLTQDWPDDADIRIGKDTTTLTETVFLKLVSAGKNLKLYVYIDKLKKRYILSVRDSLPYELIYHEFHNPDRQMDPANDFTYRIQLQKLRIAFRPENLDLIDKIQLAGYTLDDLQKIIAELNGQKLLVYK